MYIKMYWARIESYPICKVMKKKTKSLRLIQL